LDVRNVIAVPEGLEDRIGKAKHQDVLDALLPQVVVDAIDLVLAELIEHQPVERPGALETAAKGLFDHHSEPGPLLIGQCPPGEPGSAKLQERRLEGAGRDGQIEEAVAVRRSGFDLSESFANVVVCFLPREIAAGVERTLAQPLPDVVTNCVYLVGPSQRFADECAVRVVGAGLARDAEQGEAVREKLLLGEVIDGGNELPPRQVSSAAENYQRARIRHLAPA
jgi:hypothetical protein